MSAKEERLQDMVTTMQAHNLEQQQQIKNMHIMLTAICDDLLESGNSKEKLLEYYPDYLTPGERGE